ncbi:MAG: Hpt domain-containing protein [Treponema sp.]|nr:Hpt domain-containing protein [Treponema sp.]
MDKDDNAQQADSEKYGLLEEDLEFKRMLKQYFIKTCGSKFAEIVSSLEEGNIEKAHRLAHTLKGNAAQLGKSFLQKAAAEVENNLKNGSNNVTQDQLKNLDMELKAVLIDFNGN